MVKDARASRKALKTGNAEKAGRTSPDDDALITVVADAAAPMYEPQALPETLGAVGTEQNDDHNALIAAAVAGVGGTSVPAASGAGATTLAVRAEGRTEDVVARRDLDSPSFISISCDPHDQSNKK